MKLRLQTDYGLRVLLYLAFVDRIANAEEIATAFAISKDHLVKVGQHLAKHGLIRTVPGRGGGFVLERDPAGITVREVVEKMEGRPGCLDCIPSPDVCPMEPGCGLRRLLIDAENAFFDVLATRTIADLSRNRSRTGGLHNVEVL